MPTPRRGSKAFAGYKEAHAKMGEMSEDELLTAMQHEIDRGERCRPDMLSRLAGRFNRKRGDRFTKAVLGLMTYNTPSRRNIRALLDNKG